VYNCTHFLSNSILVAETYVYVRNHSQLTVVCYEATRARYPNK